MKFLNFRDRQKVMDAAREKNTVMYQQHKVMFFRISQWRCANKGGSLTGQKTASGAEY